jgi:hypothetical protein
MGGFDGEDSEDLNGDDDVADQDEVEASAQPEDESLDDEPATESVSFSEAIGDDGLDDFDDTDIDLKVVEEVLSHKDQNARALAIRRAIEERLESKRLSEDLDYLDLDLDD